MHVSKPPKIQNQTKNTTREPELKAPRIDLQIGHHVIEAETISQRGFAKDGLVWVFLSTHGGTVGSLERPCEWASVQRDGLWVSLWIECIAAQVATAHLNG